MAAPPVTQDELLPLADPGSQWFGDRGEGEDEARTPKGDQPAPQAGESGQGLGAGAREVAPRELGSGPARPPPVAMETASTGKAGGDYPANGVGGPVPARVPVSAARLCTFLALATVSTNLTPNPLCHGRL